MTIGGDVLEKAAELDLVGEGIVGAPQPPKEKPWNPERARENTRTYLAGSLVALVCVVVLGTGYDVARRGDMGPWKDFLTVIFGPIIALVGTVLGFYFGEKSALEKTEGK